MADLAIITLTRNADYLARLLAALDLQQGAPSTEMVVVDNADSLQVRTATMAYRRPVTCPHYLSGITPDRNLSFSEGNNRAVDHTTAPWLLLLNDDVIPHQNYLAALWETHRETGAEVVGSLLLHKDGTVNHAGTAVWANCRTDHIGRGLGREAFDGKDLAVTPSVTFAAALVSRYAWLKLGGLDEGYVYGWEDTDFCLRALEAGMTVGCALRAVAEHDECGTRPRGGAQDVTNYNRFRERWEAKLPKLLRAYAQREPTVEGAHA